MARARRGGTKKPKATEEKKPREKKKKPAKVKAEVGPDEDVEQPDLLPVTLVVLTGMFLLVATVIAWMHLGKYGAGPFG